MWVPAGAEAEAGINKGKRTHEVYRQAWLEPATKPLPAGSAGKENGAERSSP